MPLPPVTGREPDVANLGLARPPLVYLGSIAIGVPLVPDAVGTPLGVLVTLLAVALFVSSVRTFTIVRRGPYRFSRNPIYLAFSLLQLGLAFWVNSVALLLMLIPSVALMGLVVIPREERYLEARFPSEYSAYKATVRRWL